MLNTKHRFCPRLTVFYKEQKMSASSKEGLLALCGSLLGLSTVAVGLRVYGRRQQELPIKADDWTALGGLVSLDTF